MSEPIQIEILGKKYQIKCPEKASDSLLKAAEFLESKMKTLRGNGTVNSVDRIAVIAALNLAHELLSLEQQSVASADETEKRIQSLQNKIELALAENVEMEFQPG